MKEQIIKMEKEIEQLKIENKEKEDALIELSQFYYVRNIIIIKIKIKVSQLMKIIMKKEIINCFFCE